MNDNEILKRALYGDKSLLDDCTDIELQKPLDVHGWTALHFLAQARKRVLVTIPLAYTTLNGDEETPISILIKNCDITRETIQEYFPWYTPEENEKIAESLFKIQEMGKAEKFILSI